MTKKEKDELMKEFDMFDRSFLERVNRIFENLMKLNELIDKAEARSKIILNNGSGQR